MFERIIPVSRSFDGPAQGQGGVDELLIGNVDSARLGNGGGALRALEWSELTARLSAARDLRLLMRRDAQMNIQFAAASFGDAAASYFEAIEEDERAVNLDALEHRKTSDCMLREPTQDAATVDPRDSK